MFIQIYAACFIPNIFIFTFVFHFIGIYLVHKLLHLLMFPYTSLYKIYILMLNTIYIIDILRIITQIFINSLTRSINDILVRSILRRVEILYIS